MSLVTNGCITNLGYTTASEKRDFNFCSVLVLNYSLPQNKKKPIEALRLKLPNDSFGIRIYWLKPKMEEHWKEDSTSTQYRISLHSKTLSRSYFPVLYEQDSVLVLQMKL